MSCECLVQVPWTLGWCRALSAETLQGLPQRGLSGRGVIEPCRDDRTPEIGTFWWFFVFAFLLWIDSGEKWSHDCVESGRLLLRSTNSASHKLSWVDLSWWLKSTHRFRSPDPGASHRIYVEMVAANSRSLKATSLQESLSPRCELVESISATGIAKLFSGEVSLAGFIQWFVVFLAFEACSFFSSIDTVFNAFQNWGANAPTTRSFLVFTGIHYSERFILEGW